MKLNPKQVFLILTSHSAVQINVRHLAATNGLLHNNTIDMTGELEDKHFIVTRGDSRITMTIARNEYTVKFDRESRFLIDDEDSPHKLSYILTKPLKKGLLYDGKGVFKFVLQESTATGDDNHELGIADYFEYFMPDGTRITQGGSGTKPVAPTENPGKSDGKKVWF